ncbi:DUF262 domain-containing protein [Paraglaciecola chathamensis]|uniref:DUF262 domain-containing protein n=1 Tax=Paraglaciecola chathamensis TaxID=368405 RepID=A0ABS0WID9_9ALTE|nr:DUF262 domain-containing protein [Paraglaciecola chathamensis]MBJ2138207.1 DUF262 domain-containing protein [Paraglaciecola chathamensis]
MSNIVTELESLDRQFSKYDKILIPQYQRSYAWDDSNIQTFWQDIKESIEEDRDRYFIGPIVSKSVGEKEVEVIDGQQRLTTSLIIISIVRRICLYKYEESTNENRSYYDFYGILKPRFEVTGSLMSENGNNRYQMNEENDLIYSNFIATDAKKEQILTERKRYRKADSNYKLLDSILILWDFVESYVGKDPDLGLLKSVAVYILEKLQVLNISVSDESDAYLIFETINDRGRELDTMDLVKNLLFSRVKGAPFEKVKNNWIRMQEQLSRMSSANDFLYNFWTSYKGRSSKQNLFTQIREYIKSSNSSAIDFSNDITEAARVYSAINNPSDTYWDDFSKETRKNLTVLKELSAKVVHPIIMSALISFEKDEFNKLLRYLIIFQVRYVLIAEYHTGKYSNAASSIPALIKTNGIKKAIKVAKALKDYEVYINDQEFIDSFKVLTCSTKRAKYILSAIEEHLSGDLKVVNKDGLIVNIEHILPQEPCPEWSPEVTGISNQEYDTWAMRIGNMVLSCNKLNKEAARKKFVDKKEILLKQANEIKTTAYIEDEQHWDKEAIEKRQQLLAQQALNVWSIDFN